MGCFLACFGFTKKKRRRVANNKRHGSYKPLDSSVPVNLYITEDPICSNSEFRDKPKEQSSFKIRKKVSFNLNVQTYEPIPTDYTLLESDEEGDKKKKGEETAKRGLFSTALAMGSYPSNYRYQNCTYNYDEDDDELAYEEIDLDDDDYDNDIDDNDDSDENEDYGNNDIHHDQSQEEERVSLTQLAKDKINVMPPAASNVRELKSVGLHQNARDRSQYVHSVLNPIENLTQWKAVKAISAPVKHQRKENIELKKEPPISISSKPILDTLPFSNRSQSKQPLMQEIAVDASLSNWLVLPKSNRSETTTHCS